jgi:hypothetical protein
MVGKVVVGQLLAVRQEEVVIDWHACRWPSHYHCVARGHIPWVDGSSGAGFVVLAAVVCILGGVV